MPIQVQCVCGASFRVKDEMAGRSGKCPKCAAPITVPTPVPAAGDLDIHPTTSVGLAREKTPPCPACGTIYPPEVLICTRCGIELATGQFVGAVPGAAPGPVGAKAPRAAKAPLRTRMASAAEEKSFWKALGQAFYNPLEAFDTLGYYLLNNPANIGLCVGLFFFGTIFSAIWEVKGQSARVEPAPAPVASADDPEAAAQPAVRIVDNTIEVDNEFYYARFGCEGRTSGEMSISVYWRQKKAFGPSTAAHFYYRAVAGSGEEPAAIPRMRGQFGMERFGLTVNGVAPLQDEEDFEVEILIRKVDGGQVVGEESHRIPMKFAPPDPIEPEVEEGSVGESMIETAGTGRMVAIWSFVFVILLAVKAGFIDLLSRFIAGASRFLQIGIVLLFLEGVRGLVNAALVAGGLFLPWDVLFFIGMVVPWWGVFLYIVAIMKTYDIPVVFAIAIGVGANVILWLCFVVGIGGIVFAAFGIAGAA